MSMVGKWKIITLDFVFFQAALQFGHQNWNITERLYIRLLGKSLNNFRCNIFKDRTTIASLSWWVWHDLRSSLHSNLIKGPMHSYLKFTSRKVSTGSGCMLEHFFFLFNTSTKLYTSAFSCLASNIPTPFLFVFLITSSVNPVLVNAELLASFNWVS